SGWRKTIISEYGNARMARTDRYKLIRRYGYGGVRFADELYDLMEDPRETVNRFGDDSMGKIVDELTEELNRFFKKYTTPGHSGLDLERQWECTPDSPWLAAARLHKEGRMPDALARLLVES
ncbi:MAG TPA: sulfatase/phosphatase domain-containing protein, partial [Terriglobia bacterium]|nr:sulfatase/phosphatase domain-containing protein [Terriglobia bacterium]